MRCTKQEIGSIDFQSGCEIQEKRRIGKSRDRDHGMRFVSVPRLDALDHEALLPKFPLPLGEIIWTPN
jgi:hypothetical protein